MPKAPDPEKVEEYDQTRRFCRIMFFLFNKLAEQSGEQSFLPEDLPDSWRNGDQTLAAALSSMKMACRDVLEMTQDYDRSALELFDQMLSSQAAPTLSEMRVRHWKLIPKILKRGQIRNEEEFYLVKGCIDRLDVAESDRARMAGLLDEFETSAADAAR